METVYKVKTKQIKLKSSTEKIKIWFFGDIHRFTKSCDEDRWKWFLQKAKASHDEHTYYMGLGDYCDFASAKEQKALLKTADIHAQTIEDFGDMVKKRNRVLSMEMSFMKGHLLGLIDGNHNWVFSNGQTSTEDLAERLETEYLGWLCHYTLNVIINGGKVQNVYIVPCHGKAGGKTAGNTLNQVADLRAVFPIADIYVQGHDHQRGAWPSSILIPSIERGTGNVVLKQKRQFLCRSGSFKKAYVEDCAGYEVGRLLKPADLGALLLEIGFHREESSNNERIITDIKAII